VDLDRTEPSLPSFPLKKTTRSPTGHRSSAQELFLSNWGINAPDLASWLPKDHSSTGGMNEQTMKNTSIILRTLGLVMVLLCTRSQAQTPTIARERISLHVDGLTSETRDDLARELKRSGDARIVFACVPAGIIVLEARPGLTRTELETRSNQLLSNRSATSHARRVEHTIVQAEAACEQARNR